MKTLLRPWRAVTTVVLAAGLILAATTGGGSPAHGHTSRPAAAPSQTDDGKLAPGLERRFERSGGGPQDFWILFGPRADTSGARSIDDWAERGQYVVDQLQQTAHEAQADTIKRLDAAKVKYTAYWITDAIRVEHGSYPLAVSLSGEPEVDRLIAPVQYEQPDPINESLTSSRLGTDATTASAEWGVQNVKADQVWGQYGIRGDGIVVANVDTGVQFEHPALVDSYRGNNGDGTFTNDYNWFDPTGQSRFPTDDNGHGTHTMGTMVGDDHAANQVGIAPGATWIAARGCESRSCSDASLMAASQWMLAPTKVDGSDPDPAMRPNIINNSWGSDPSTDPFMEDIQQAWADAGIFGAWANGNNGPGCNTSGSPGSRTLNYSVGAYDQSNTIASFSSRGPGQDGEVKPNISAPGVNVRSSFPTNQYALANGTSMATPHVAGAVAMLWAADPALIGDIAATRQLLDDTATDTPDSQCGGTDDDNNVYGEGRLDSLALVQTTNPDATGIIAGALTDATTGDPVPAATIRLATGSLSRSARGAADGTYTTNIAAGDYQATITAFGYQPTTVNISVTSGQTTTTNVSLTPVEGFTITGRVIDQPTGRGISGAIVTIADTRFAATTSQDGTFTVTGVPGPRTYTVHVDGGGCSQHDVFRSISVTGDTALPAIELARKADQPFGSVRGSGPPYGYSCILEPTQWIPGDTPIEMPPRGGSTPVDLPFGFTYFGVQYDTLNARQHNLSFASTSCGLAGGMQPFGSNADPDDRSQILTRTTGTAPNRRFTVEFRDFSTLSNPEVRFSFEVTLYEDGGFVFAYKDIDPDRLFERGNQDSVGIGDHSPDDQAGCRTGLVYSSRSPVLDNDRQIHFSLPPNGFVNGTIVDHNTHQPIAGATVNAYDHHGTRVPVRTLTDPNGHYRLQLFTGQPYQIEVLKPPGYQAPPRQTAKVTTDRQILDLKTELHGGGIRVKPNQLTLSPNDRPATIQLKNNGDRTLDWRASTHIPEPDAPAPGTELSSLTLNDMIPTGVEEVDGSYWVSGIIIPEGTRTVRETTTAGQPTGRGIDLGRIADALGLSADVFLVPGDMAWIKSRGWLCISFFRPVNDIACVDPTSGDVTAVIPTGMATNDDVDGLAYDEASDRFFVDAWIESGGFQHRIQTVAGVQHPDPGKVLNTCTYTRQAVGLAWNPTSQTLWTNTKPLGQTVLRQIDPATCTEIASLPAPRAADSASAAAPGLDLEPGGDFVAATGFGLVISTTRSPDRIGQNLPWLSVSASSGSLKPGRSLKLTVAVDWASVPDDVTQVLLRLRGNGGARSEVTVPIRLAETHHGTPGSDRIEGTDWPDVIQGRGGDDTLLGRGGDDRIVGADGSDTIDGGTGADVLYGGGGSDQITSSDGRDLVYAGAARDVVHLRRDGVGDTIWCGPGRDRAVYHTLRDHRDVIRGCERVVIRP